MESEYDGPERRRAQKLRNRLVATVLVLLILLTGVSLYGAFVTAPTERREIRETAATAKGIADALAKSNAGLTALLCTNSNRHDTIDLAVLEANPEIAAAVREALKEDPSADPRGLVPPPSNCGELICQFFREIEEPGAEIVIEDPFGPDRKQAPCGPAPEQPADG